MHVGRVAHLATRPLWLAGLTADALGLRIFALSRGELAAWSGPGAGRAGPIRLPSFVTAFGARGVAANLGAFATGHRFLAVGARPRLRRYARRR